MEQLEILSRSLAGCDVVACTGDCVSSSTKQVAASWDKWPQRLKLLVPGNHDDTSDTFAHLTSWVTSVPWYRRHGRINFIGLDYGRDLGKQIEELAPTFEPDNRAVALLSHRWPDESQAKPLAKSLRKFFPGRPVLYLHGDNHPLGAYWDPMARLDDLLCHRSNIVSCANGSRGAAHLITWDSRRFTCQLKEGFPLNAILEEAARMEKGRRTGHR